MLNLSNKDDHCRRTTSATAPFPFLARKQIVTVLTALLTAFNCAAQNQPQAAQPQAAPSQSQIMPAASPANATAAAAPHPADVTIPANTRFALVLTNPVSSKNVRRGDEVYAQTTAPVLVGDRAVIPAGIFVQGRLDKVKRDGSRAEMQISSAAIVFPDGYIASVTGPLNMESDEGTAWRDPGSAARAGAILAPFAGAGIGALIGSAAHTTQSATLGGTTISSSSPKGVAIGSVVGLAVGGVVSIAILLNSRQFFVDVGSPMEITLPQPVTLPEDQVTRAAREVQEHPIAVPMAAPRPLAYPPYDHGICFTPGTPGTPPTIIPGTPPIGSSPGTPPTVIPGTPPTPGTPYPCP